MDQTVQKLSPASYSPMRGIITTCRGVSGLGEDFFIDEPNQADLGDAERVLFETFAVLMEK